MVARFTLSDLDLVVDHGIDPWGLMHVLGDFYLEDEIWNQVVDKDSGSTSTAA